MVQGRWGVSKGLSCKPEGPSSVSRTCGGGESRLLQIAPELPVLAVAQITSHIQINSPTIICKYIVRKFECWVNTTRGFKSLTSFIKCLLNSRHPCDGSQPPVTPVSGNQCPLLTSSGPRHIHGTHMYIQSAHTRVLGIEPRSYARQQVLLTREPSFQSPVFKVVPVCEYVSVSSGAQSLKHLPRHWEPNPVLCKPRKCP